MRFGLRFACFRLEHVKKFLGIPDFDSPSSDLDGVIPVGDGEVSKVGRVVK